MSYDNHDFMAQVDSVLKEVSATLAAKNTAYGNSALEPIRVFSKASTEEQLLVRIDDKLSRLQRGSDAGEDVVLDLIGYLVLLRIARKSAVPNPSPGSWVRALYLVLLRIARQSA